MSSPANSESWKSLLDKKARDLHQQIAATHTWVQQNAHGDPEVFDNLTRKLFDWLRDLYEHELPLVKILDGADLSLELIGPATRTHHPRLSLVSTTFKKVQDRVRSVTKSIPGLTESSSLEKNKRFRLPPEVELGFTSLAVNDTLRFGFTLPEFDEENLLKEHDPAYIAVREAISSIRLVSMTLADMENEEAAKESLSESISDPKLRDSAMLAVKDLSPSMQGKNQVTAVKIAGRGVKVAEIKPLTTDSRKALGHILAKPVDSREEETFTGFVREIDLDDKRFDLRQITDGAVNDLRCIYSKGASDSAAKSWLNSQVKVSGRVQRDPEGKPRLMRVRRLVALDRADGSKQAEFDFPDE